MNSQALDSRDGTRAFDLGCGSRCPTILVTLREFDLTV
jgi:hypothetical protein